MIRVIEAVLTCSKSVSFDHFSKGSIDKNVDNRDTSQNRLCYISDKNNKLRRKEYLLRDILKSVVIGLTMIFFEALKAVTYV